MAGKVNIGKLRKTYVTPVGTAVYPRLNTPDTKFKPEGEYTIKLRLEGDEAATVAAFLDSFEKEAHAQAELNAGRKLKLGTNRPYKAAEDEEGNEIPGVIIVNFKMKASGKAQDGREWTQKPAVVDAKKRAVTATIGGGSKVKVAAILDPYFTAQLGFGVSMKFNAVQVLELVERGGRGADVFGEEDGYEAPAASTTTDTEVEGDDTGADF